MVKRVADPTDLERCLTQIREQLAKSEATKGKVICNLTWHGAINAVAEELTSEELRRVIFRVAA